jgi:hypothetical protein
MPQEFWAVRCYADACGAFQVQLAKKSNKFVCSLCGTGPQSVLKLYGIGNAAKDVRLLVQRLNTARGAAAAEAEAEAARAEEERWSGRPHAEEEQQLLALRGPAHEAARVRAASLANACCCGAGAARSRAARRSQILNSPTPPHTRRRRPAAAPGTSSTTALWEKPARLFRAARRTRARRMITAAGMGAS